MCRQLAADPAACAAAAGAGADGSWACIEMMTSTGMMTSTVILQDMLAARKQRARCKLSEERVSIVGRIHPLMT